MDAILSRTGIDQPLANIYPWHANLKTFCCEIQNASWLKLTKFYLSACYIYVNVKNDAPCKIAQPILHFHCAFHTSASFIIKLCDAALQSKFTYATSYGALLAELHNLHGRYIV
jgi:hypothetical protein